MNFRNVYKWFSVFPSQLFRFTSDRKPPLPDVSITHGPVVPAWVVRLLGSLIPLFALVITTLRLPSRWAVVVPLLLTLAALLAVAAWVWPSAVFALVTIGLVAFLSLARPPSLPWALGLATLGYLGFRSALLAQQLPRLALIERSVLLRAARRDLAVLAVTSIIGIVSVGARRLTACYATGVSVGTMGHETIGQTCHPVGDLLVVAAAIALLALALSFSRHRTS